MKNVFRETVGSELKVLISIQLVTLWFVINDTFYFEME